VKEFGAELIDVVRRVAQEVVQPKLERSKNSSPRLAAVQQMAPAVQQNSEDQARTAADLAHERICSGLDTLVVDQNGNSMWERINDSTEFQTWLTQVDPYAGVQRGAMLAQATESGPSAGLDFLHGLYERTRSSRSDRTAASADSAGHTPRRNPGREPSFPRSSGHRNRWTGKCRRSNESGQQRVYTQAEIGAFYRDVQRGGYKGRDADKIAIERDIFQAQKSGRVRP